MSHTSLHFNFQGIKCSVFNIQVIKLYDKVLKQLYTTDYGFQDPPLTQKRYYCFKAWVHVSSLYLLERG